MNLTGKNIILGVTGSIAAYKSAEITRQLIKLGANVFCVMTKSATSFISPLTLQTLSKHPVAIELFKPIANWDIEHIELSKKADMVLIAPATANLIGKIASGIADDMLTTLILAVQCPILIAPAMNNRMYQNPITQNNIEKLKAYGMIFIEPEKGDLACGEEAIGRLANLRKIIDNVESALEKDKPLLGKTILITAGATQEPIDPVRYITNYSSGKMGYALAKIAYHLGARVILISAKTQIESPVGVEIIQVKTAQEMHLEVLKAFKQTDAVISAAAISDYRTKNIASEKIKKGDNTLILELEKNPDILADLGRTKGNKILVGFAAETSDLIKNAQTKLKEKNLDLIVANDITKQGSGFGSDTNQVTLISQGDEIKHLPLLDKEDVARKILDEIVRLFKGERNYL